MSEFAEYDGWRAVPPDLFTRSQLRDMDMPRMPIEWARPVAAVTAPGAVRRRERYQLYDVAHTVPSPASARALRSARARQGWDAFICDDCGAVSELPLAEHPDRTRLCPACRHIVTIRAVQAKGATVRAGAIVWAMEQAADDAVLIVSAVPVLPPPAPSGRIGTPVALHVTGAHTNLTTVLDVTAALVGPRSKNLPAHAVPAEQAWRTIRAALKGRRLLIWDRYDTASALHPAELDPQTLRTAASDPIGEQVHAWRGRTNPDRPGVYAVSTHHPGRADRMALLLRRMAGQPDIDHLDSIGNNKRNREDHDQER